MAAMRFTALMLIVAACGGGGSNGKDTTEKKDAPTTPPVDAAPEHDAPPLLTCTPKNGTTISIRSIGQVSGSAVLATSPKNDGRLFVLEQQGRIRIFENEMLVATPYLDINTLVAGGTPPNEQGLLGLAFHPNFANNRQFYVFYTTSNANVVARYTQSEANPNVADTTGEVILSIPDFAANHNGGMIEFGKDGFLYIGTGDGGNADDPQRTAQNPDALLGKILRIDVNSEANGKKYAIPAGNPYASGGGAPEVYILGLRNPWRWSFDTATGDLWIGDVGQDTDEEVTVLKDGMQAGANLGWSMYEGTRCFGNYTCDPANKTMPQVVRPQSAGWVSVIGGQVYRGDCFPDLKGTYIFADYGANTAAFVRGKLEANGTVTTTTIPNPTGWPGGRTSIHADARGELYMTTTNGRVYAIEAGP
jgi:glucose/arabinose dehydrogenase